MFVDDTILGRRTGPFERICRKTHCCFCVELRVLRYLACTLRTRGAENNQGLGRQHPGGSSLAIVCFGRQLNAGWVELESRPLFAPD